ncbi:hypothetical protein TNCV_3372641 [Trichonephila clavipes]|nr:hypothetical protein TNCV_3372641 [Trichonephila clavipes]
MSKTSAYVNSDVFMKCLRNNFIPRKEPEKVILISDGHASHCLEPGRTVENGTSGFPATGIYHYNPQVIPFAISDGSNNDRVVVSTSGACDMTTPAVALTSRASGRGLSLPAASTSTEHARGRVGG